MNPQLTPEQAVEVLDQVASKYTGTRQEHILLMEAIKIVKNLTMTNSDMGIANDIGGIRPVGVQ